MLFSWQMYSMSLRVGLEPRAARGGKRLGIRARIVDGDIDSHVPQIGAVVAFDGVELFRVWVAQIIEPELVVEAHRIHHQRVLVPRPDGVPVPGRVGIVGMLAVHEDLPEAVDVPFK